MIRVCWFNNRQAQEDILQPKFFTPKSHLHLYAELPDITLPITIDVTASHEGTAIFNKSYTIEESGGSSDFYYGFIKNSAFELRDFVSTTACNPDRIDVEIRYADKTHTQSIVCEYATISGKITDFDGKAFPAAVWYNFLTFDGKANGLGVWSDREGNYSITLPKTQYNSVFVDDKSYARSTLEAWAWKMIVDRDEAHDYKVGNGEVYSLDVWANNGGSQSLFIFFRPMVLPYAKSEMFSPIKIIKRQFNRIDINGKKYKPFVAFSDMDINDIHVEINGIKANNISIQKIAETGTTDTAMFAYILQVERIPGKCIGKQTLTVEYDYADAKGKKSQAQGRTQFFYTSAYGLAVR